MLLLNLLDHPNILSYKIAFISKQDLWLIFEILEGGSIEKIIQAHYPQGIKDQVLIATILKETLQGIRYLHQNEQIHRDIKGGNILIGADGSVKISDFGVTAKLKKGQKRNTFIGSPCYMAPEVLDQDGRHGYDSKADIWSLGITALELAHGKPPNSDLTTMKLIIKTLNDEPPKLNKESYFDDSFQEFISYCLVKDPIKRKSADELLKASKSFFSKAKGKEYIKEKLLKGLGSLESRVDSNTIALVELERKNEVPTKKIYLEFDLSLDEDEPLSDTDIQLNPNYNTHLSKPDSEYYLKKSLSANTVNKESQRDDYHFEYLEHTKDVEQIKKNEVQMVRNLCTASFVHREKEEGKISLSKGDDFNCLPEEEN